MSFGEKMSVKLNWPGIAAVCGVALIILLYTFGFPSPSQKVSVREVLTAGIQVARLGGQLVKQIRENADLHEQEKGKTKEGAAELKTDGDMASHKVMYYTLKHKFPNIKIFSEEHASVPVQESELPILQEDIPELQSLLPSRDDIVDEDDVTIWIDPLDATQEYTENLRQYVTTMVCIAVRGRPVAGVVHRVFKQETEWAYVGKAMSPNLQKAKSSSNTESTGHPKIIVSRSHSGDVEKVAKASLGDDTEVIPAGGAGYKTLEVIANNVDAYVHVTAIKKWDICAGDALIQAVGGRQTTLEHQLIDYGDSAHPLNPDGLLVTMKNHDKYLEKLRPVFEENKKTEH